MFTANSFVLGIINHRTLWLLVTNFSSYRAWRCCLCGPVNCQYVNMPTYYIYTTAHIWFKVATCTQDIGAAPRKMKQRSRQSLKTTSLSYSNAKSTVLIPLTFNRVKKTKRKNFDFVPFLSYFLCFFLARRSSKRIWCMQILNIPHDCSAKLLHSYLVWASCELWVTSYGLTGP